MRPTKPWRLRPADAGAVERIARSRRVPAVVARVLVGRGHVEPEATAAHLQADLHSLHSPADMPGIEAATERIALAIEREEKILVHGDYDVDGVCGTALLVRLFRLVGARCDWFIPNRFEDGYSFGPHSVARCREREASLVVSVDNGTSSRETIAELAELGIDTLVTDHHEPPLGELPPAIAIVNPKLADSTYPFRELCGAGVAFKLAWGVCQHISGSRKVREDLRAFLTDAMSYVALATVCDVVPLLGENRVFSRRGLQALERSEHAGLRALLEVTDLKGKELLAEDIGFKLGPRLNAAGRLATAATSVELLLCDDADHARSLARQLDDFNRERRELESELVRNALSAAEEFDDEARWPVLVVAGEGWHQGVVGIVAARMVDRTARPALVLGIDGERARGSARSIDGFSILEAMHGGAELFEKYGGHAQAAGCELAAQDIDDVREAINARARELLVDGALPARPLWIDFELPLTDVTPRLMRYLDLLEPFGKDNEKPVLLSSSVRLVEPPRVVGQDQRHLILRVRSGASEHKALAFGMAERSDELAMGEDLHLVYTPRWNTFRGEKKLELVLHDFKRGEAPSL